MSSGEKITLATAEFPPIKETRAPEGRIITFYSYKGGTGRTMALANAAWLLALNNRRVLVIDWDLEAPGLHRYFHPFLDDPELLETRGLLDLVVDLAASAASQSDPLPAEAVDIFEYVQNLNWPRNSGSGLKWKSFGTRGRIDFLAAGRQGPAYARQLASFDWIKFYEKFGGRGLLLAAKHQMCEVYDYVLIDSRTGVSDTSGICTVEMPDTLVICFTLNNQSILGASAIADSVRSARMQIDPGLNKPAFRIFPVPSRVEVTSEQEKLRAALDLAQATFAPYLDHMNPRDHSRYWGGVQMAYFPYYAFEEVPAVFGDRPDQQISLSTSVRELVRVLTDGTVKDVPRATLKLPDVARTEAEGWYVRRVVTVERSVTPAHSASVVPRDPKLRLQKVFISSTTEDLDAYRIAARDAVILAGCHPVTMEYFTPQGQRKPYPASMREVDACDMVIAIVAHRYGWVPDDQPGGDSKSIIWLECERAKEVIAFLVDDKHPWPSELKESYRVTNAIEDGSLTAELAAEVQRNVARLREFKSWLNTLGYCGTFTNEHDLKAGVLHALMGKAEKRGDPSKYLQWLREQTAWIDIRGLQVGVGKANRFPIQDLYIPLTTVAPAGKDLAGRWLSRRRSRGSAWSSSEILEAARRRSCDGSLLRRARRPAILHYRLSRFLS